MVVDFTPPVAGEDGPYENFRVVAVQDTAEQRRLELGSAASTVSPGPTGRWVAIAVALIHHYNPSAFTWQKK